MATKAKSEKLEEGLVRVKKDGVTLDVHHTCVPAHQAIGWQVVEVQPEPEAE